MFKDAWALFITDQKYHPFKCLPFVYNCSDNHPFKCLPTDQCVFGTRWRPNPVLVKLLMKRILHFFPGIQEKYKCPVSWIFYRCFFCCPMWSPIWRAHLLQVRSVLEGAEGVILESYGTGDIPGSDLLRKALSEAKSRKGLMLNCTQVYTGSTRSNYVMSHSNAQSGSPDSQT